MKFTTALFLMGSAACLLGLVLLRVLAPSVVVGGGLGLVLTVAWPLLLCLAVANWRNLYLMPWSVWRTHLLISVIVGAALTDIGLGLHPASLPSDPGLRAFLAGFFLIIGVFITVGWWSLIRGPAEQIARQQRVNPVWLVTFAVVLVLAVVLSKTIK